jgi:hypothetical protein
MSLQVQRNEGESWRDSVIRHSRPWGLDEECLEIFDAKVSENQPEDDAAWDALYEWDCLEYVDEPGPVTDEDRFLAKPGC